MSNTRPVGSEVLYTLPAAVTKNTFTTEAAISGVLGTSPVAGAPGGVCKLDAGWLQNGGVNPIGRMLRLTVRGIIANTAAATFALALGMDPTAGTKNQGIVVNAAYTPTSGVTAPFEVNVLYVCTAFATSTATWQVNGSVRYEAVAAGGAPSTAAQVAGFRGTHAGVDPRVDLYLELFGTWSASNVLNSTTIDQMMLEGLN